ncbi:MAG: hypothetical protein AAF713_20880 [Pseudomonadota bacterium]
MAYVTENHVVDPRPAKSVARSATATAAALIGVARAAFEAGEAYRRLSNRTDAQLAEDGMGRAEAAQKIGTRFF